MEITNHRTPMPLALGSGKSDSGATSRRHLGILCPGLLTGALRRLGCRIAAVAHAMAAPLPGIGHARPLLIHITA